VTLPELRKGSRLVEHREDGTFKKGNYKSISVFILYDRLLKY
jgi:hypothetical protein